MTSEKGEKSRREKPRLSRPLRWGIFIILIFLTFLNIYFHYRQIILQRALPYISTMIKQYAADELDASIEWDSVEITRFGQVVFTGIVFRLEGTEEPLAVVDRVAIAIDEKKMLQSGGQPLRAIRRINIRGMHLKISRDESGKFNVAGFFKKGKAFDPEAFPLRCALKFSRCSIEYTDSTLPLKNTDSISVTDFRGGIDLRDISDVKIGLLCDIPPYTSRQVALRGTASLVKSQVDISVAGEIDSAQVMDALRIEGFDADVSGKVRVGLNSKGSYADGYFPLLPKGVFTIKDGSVGLPFLYDILTDINGALNIAFSDNPNDPWGRVHSEGIKITYGKTTSGVCDFRAGWAGEFAYALDLDVEKLNISSLGPYIPASMARYASAAGSVDASLSVLGTEDGPAVKAHVTPREDFSILGIPLDKGSVAFSYRDSRLFIEDASLSSPGGASLAGRGFIKLDDLSASSFECSFSGVPLDAAPKFLPAVENWELAGTIDGAVAYSTEGHPKAFDIRLVTDGIESTHGEINSGIATLRVSRKGLWIDGAAVEAFGGWITAAEDSDGRTRFAASGVDGDVVLQAFGVEGVSVGTIDAVGDAVIRAGDFETDMEFSLADISYRELGIESISGGLSIQPDSATFHDVKLVGKNEELVELNGNVPLDGRDDMKLALTMREFDFGKLIPGRDGPPLTHTNASVEITGTKDDLNLSARVYEHDMNLLGNMAYTCDASCVGQCTTGDERATEGEIVLGGKISLGHTGDGGFNLGQVELKDVSVTGAICIGPHPTGLPKPSEYKHLLLGSTEPVSRASNGAIKINGVVAVDARLNGLLTEPSGDINLSAPKLKLGLQEVSDFRLGIAAAGPSSYAVDGRWSYPAGGSIALSGPAGWDMESRTGFVALDLDVSSAPVNEVFAFAGLDISEFAAGAFDGGGRITGPIGDLSFSEFRMDVSEGSRLLGMSVDEGRIEFGLSNGILSLDSFKVVSKERLDGGRCIITGSGELYIEEAGVLPQAHLTASVDDYRLEDLRTALNFDIPLGGRLDTDISYDEQARTWNIDSFKLSGLMLGTRKLPELEAGFVFNPLAGRIEVTRLRMNDGFGGWVEASGYATLGTLTALFSPDMRKDLRYQRLGLDFTGKDFDLGSLAGILPNLVQFGGKLNGIDLHITEKPTLPAIDGTINLSLGPIKFGNFLIADEISTYSGNGLTWRDGVLESDGDIYIKRGDAYMNLVGDLDLRPLNPLVQYEKRYEAPPDNEILLAMSTDTPLTLEGTGFSFRVIPEGLTMGITGGKKEVNGKEIAGGVLNVRGVLNVLSGTLDASRIQIPVATSGVAPAVNYDISVKLGKGVRLKAGNGFNATLESSELNLSGTPLTPKLAGRVEISGGEINFASRTFTLQRGSEVTFNPLFGINPFLKAEAEIYISQHPKAEPGAEPLIINAKIESFLTDLQKGIKFTSNYPYSNNELLAILGYQEVFLALEEGGFSGAFTSGLYIYPTELVSRYVRDLAGFTRFDLTFTPEDDFVIDLETKMFFDNLLLNYTQTFGQGTNYVWGVKYRFRPRSYAGFKYYDLDLRDRHDWVYYVEYLLPLK